MYKLRSQKAYQKLDKKKISPQEYASFSVIFSSIISTIISSTNLSSSHFFYRVYAFYAYR